MSMKFSSSVLFVEDVEKTRYFYEKLLGQVVELDHGECVVFAGGFSLWQREYGQKVIFGRVLDAYQGIKHDFELYFETDKLDEIYGQLEEANVELVHSVVEQPWGQRVFRLFDPDQHIVEIGEPMNVVVKRYLDQGMAVDEVVAKTSMPVEIVKAIQAAE